MCLIVVKEKGKDLPKEEYLRNGNFKNSDGIGIAYLKENTNIIKIKKDFDCFWDLNEFLTKNITKEDILIIHFRWATHGLKDKGNRHPFPIVKDKEKIRKIIMDSKMVMAHNGVLRQFGDNDTFSDTQQFILEILSDKVVKENIKNSGIQLLINEFLGGDRMVTLRNNGEIWYFGDWEKDDNDIQYSNSGYKETIHRFHRGESTLYGRHWDGESFYDIDKWNKSDKTEDNPKNKYNSQFPSCDNCYKYKKTKLFSYKGNHFLFCKACKKLARKGKINLNMLNMLKDDEKEFNNDINENMMGDEKDVCASCYEEFPIEDLNWILGNSYKVCEDCKKAIEDEITKGSKK